MGACLGTATLALVLVRSASPAEDYQVVVHRAKPITAMTRARLSDIFLGNTTEWEDGSRILLVEQLETSPVRQDFSRHVHRRAASAVRSYWLQRMYAGRAVPPVEKATDEDVIAYVKSHPGAIGYVNSSASTDTVKVLKVDP